MRCDASFPTQHLLLFQLLGLLEGLCLCSLFLCFDFSSRLIHLLLVSFEDIHKDDVGAKDTYVKSQMTKRDNSLLSLVTYAVLE